jgi:muramoyltetrapeptide carboxypeptidase LdcA involved in peptidoglycan recycling
MMNGKSANFDRRLTKLENSKLGVPANLAGFRIRKITVREGDDVDQIIRDMEARGEIPPVPADFPAGHINTIVHTIVDWPKRDKQMAGFEGTGPPAREAEVQTTEGDNPV